MRTWDSGSSRLWITAALVCLSSLQVERAAGFMRARREVTVISGLVQGFSRARPCLYHSTEARFHRLIKKKWCTEKRLFSCGVLPKNLHLERLPNEPSNSVTYLLLQRNTWNQFGERMSFPTLRRHYLGKAQTSANRTIRTEPNL